MKNMLKMFKRVKKSKKSNQRLIAKDTGKSVFTKLINL